MSNDRFPCGNAPIQSHPLNCESDYSALHCASMHRAPECSREECSQEPCSVVPPPIPPVRYVPGMNVQEQLCNMASHVNTAINRWNQIQADCYKALDQVVGAAVNNDVYYAPDEVRFMEGYSEDAACSYSIVEARAVDRSGKPIFCHLRPAYNNETNSGAQENITDVSFVTSAQMVITAFQATEVRWKGASVFNCNPGNSQPDDTVWVAGWNRNGVLRFFRGDVGQDTLRQNRMVSCIGPVFPVIKDGAPFTEVLGSLGETPGSIQAMGWKPNGNKMFFSCGVYDQPGMTPTQVMKVLQGFGCSTAVITSYQTQAATAWDATPIAGTDNTVPEGGGEVITAPGLTGGMTFLGRLSAAPLQWNIPANAANWVISKKPTGGWRNAFTTEVANVVQNMGSQENKMNSILGQLKGENEDISKLQYQVTQNTDNISKLQITVGGFDTRITSLEKNLDEVQNSVQGISTQLESEIQLRDQQYKEITDKAAQEQAEREAGDAALRAAINQEVSARESGDRVLQSGINTEASERRAADTALKADIEEEATTRANADRNLQAAIEAEQSARSTKDTQHEARMDALQAEIEKNKQDTDQALEGITDGSSLPLASSTNVGVIKVGRNLTVEADGTLNAEGGSGGDSIVAGPGIKVQPNTSGQKVVSIDEAVVVNEDQLATTNSNVTKNANAIDAINQKQAETDTEISGLTTRVETSEDNITNITNDMTELTDKMTAVESDITGIKNGSALPIASATTLGAFKVGANLSISTDGTLSASGGGEGGGETVAQGAGISVTHDDETHVATVALDAATQTTLASVADKADKATVEELQTTVAGKADKSVVDSLNDTVTTQGQTIQNHSTRLDSVESTANTAASGVSALNSSVTALTATVSTNTQNIDANSTAIASTNETITKLQGDVEAIDDTATAAMDHAASAEEEAAKKVNKAGDTMTGNLGVPRVNLTSGGNTASGLTASIGSVNYAGQTSPATITQINKSSGTASVLRGVDAAESDTDVTPKAYVDTQDDAVRSVAQAANVAATEANQNATEAKGTAQQALTAASSKVSKAGDSMTGKLGVVPGIITNYNQGLIIDSTEDAGELIADGVQIMATTEQAGSNIRHVTTIKQALYPGAGGDISTNLTKLKGLANPVYAHDAANKQYVDSKAGGPTYHVEQIVADNFNATIKFEVRENNYVMVGAKVQLTKNTVIDAYSHTSLYSGKDPFTIFPNDGGIMAPEIDANDTFASIVLTGTAAQKLIVIIFNPSTAKITLTSLNYFIGGIAP